MKIQQIVLAETVGVALDGKVGAHGVHSDFIVLSNIPSPEYPAALTFGFLLLGSLTEKGEQVSGTLKIVDDTSDGAPNALLTQTVDNAQFRSLPGEEGNQAGLVGMVMTGQAVNFQFTHLGKHYIVFEDSHGHELIKREFEVTARNPKVQP